MFPPPSARLTFRSWTDEDTALAEALWCDPEVTRFFGGAMSREQARDRLHVECERDITLGMQYWPIFLRETGKFCRVCRSTTVVDGSRDSRSRR